METEFAWASPEKDFQAGTLVRFVYGPPRYKGEARDHRCPGGDLLGKHGVVISGPFPDSHQWGGVFHVHFQGVTVSHWGDFMEPACVD
tara:strand:- start:2074 stop:2337 length:264 start_codon:yes stop_codon:yes gene_type:complete